MRITKCNYRFIGTNGYYCFYFIFCKVVFCRLLYVQRIFECSAILNFLFIISMTKHVENKIFSGIVKHVLMFVFNVILRVYFIFTFLRCHLYELHDLFMLDIYSIYKNLLVIKLCLPSTYSVIRIYNFVYLIFTQWYLGASFHCHTEIGKSIKPCTTECPVKALHLFNFLYLKLKLWIIESKNLF